MTNKTVSIVMCTYDTYLFLGNQGLQSRGKTSG